MPGLLYVTGFGRRALRSRPLNPIRTSFANTR
jgi:hypothetical protein